jgi:putative restriction endonuclease
VTFDHRVFDHVPPWTEEEYLALDETTSLVELVRGALWVSPSPNDGFHQEVFGQLVGVLRAAAANTEFRAVGRVSARLAPDTITNPDFVVATNVNWGALVLDAADIRLIGEITTPGSALIDRSFKPHLYAAAGIEWFLLVELDYAAFSASLRLHRLAGDHYVKHAAAKPGKTLKLDDPFSCEIDAAALIRD